jgi:hypothetical protein
MYNVAMKAFEEYVGISRGGGKFDICLLDVTYFSKKLSRVRVTIDGVCNGNWIY